MTVNVELLKKIRNHIILYPENFDMGDWVGGDAVVTGSFMDFIAENGPPVHCGTTCCLGGFAVAFASPAELQTARRLNGFSWSGGLSQSVSETAQSLLGLETDDLFFRGQWPQEAFDMEQADGAVYLITLILNEVGEL